MKRHFQYWFLMFGIGMALIAAYVGLGIKLKEWVLG
jgi:hypothetical protein